MPPMPAGNPAKAKFCNDCAARLDVICPQCAQPNPSGSCFCNECGHPLDLAAAPAPAPRFPAPEAYIPKHLAEKILTSKSALEGERKQVTVLFADLKGSMELWPIGTPRRPARSWTLSWNG